MYPHILAAALMLTSGWAVPPFFPGFVSAPAVATTLGSILARGGTTQGVQEYSRSWSIVYATYPSLLREIERLGFHSGRQPYVLGRLNPRYQAEDLRRHLAEQGFEPAILAWKDSGEVLSMRKVDKHIFQWHVRLFSDGEIRGHYEYSPEGGALGHIFETAFKPDEERLQAMLGELLVRA